MRILMSASAFDRVGANARMIAPDAAIVTIGRDRAFSQDGRAVEEGSLAADILWISRDTWNDGLVDPMMDLATRLKPGWLQANVAGFDDRRWRRIFVNGTRVTKNTGAALSMAEYVMAHALSLLVPIDAQRDLQRRREWKLTSFDEVSRSRWTLIGWGAIGQAVAKRALAFDAHVDGVRRTPGEDPLVGHTHGLADLPDLLPKSDVVVLALPANRNTAKLCDARFLAALKPGAILINVARGSLIDYDALRIGLNNDQPGHAVLDTFETEPLATDDWMWDHPKVRVTAHTSWFGNSNSDRADEQFLDNLERFRAGRPLLAEASAQEVD